ncbi:MAG TPA: AAA family ATPase [Marmoricola sp.]|nr:AAA family ATPase [Marmoricola sp.]
MPFVVVVTGVPGSGKSTLARDLADALEAELISLDTIKEELYDAHAGALDGFDLRLAAEREVTRRLDRTHTTAVVDIWVQPARDVERMTVLFAAEQVVEVLCRVPAALAVDRYVRRPRTGPHKSPDDATLQRIRDAADVIAPLGTGPCIEVDTSVAVDCDALTAAVLAVTPRSGPAGSVTRSGCRRRRGSTR